MRRRYQTRLLVAAAIIALGWPLIRSGDAPEPSRARRFQGAPGAADSATSSVRGSQSAGREGAAEGEAFEVARNREGHRPGSAIGRIRWRNVRDSDGDTVARSPSAHDASKKLAVYGVEAIELNPLTIVEGVESVRFSGEDPLAPRALIAWRNRSGSRSVLARGWSDEEGALHFPRVLVPQNGLEVSISDASSTPDDPGSSVAQSLPGRLPVVAQAHLIDFSDGEYRLRITPIEGVGNVLLADADGMIFANYEVPSNSNRAERIFDVAVTSPNPFILIGHEFSDGRTSDWQIVELKPPAGVAAGS